MVKQESKIRTNDKKSVLAAVLALAVGSVASCAALAAVSGCPDFEV